MQKMAVIRLSTASTFLCIPTRLITLVGNHIRDAGVTEFAKVLTCNNTLMHLDLKCMLCLPLRSLLQTLFSVHSLARCLSPTLCDFSGGFH